MPAAAKMLGKHSDLVQLGHARAVLWVRGHSQPPASHAVGPCCPVNYQGVQVEFGGAVKFALVAKLAVDFVTYQQDATLVGVWPQPT